LTVLVTGGAGYIGSLVVHELVGRGEGVVVLDNLATGFAEALPASAQLVIGDVADGDLVAGLMTSHDVESVMHFAASTVVPDSFVLPGAYYRNNTAAALVLFEAAASSGVRHVVFSSTAAVYGNPAKLPVPETATPAPLSPYGTSKWMAELMLRDVAAAASFSFVTLRYFNVAGADPSGRTGQSTAAATHLVKAAVQAALGIRDCLYIYGTDYPTRDGTCVRDYIHVTDLAAAHLAALDHLRAGGKSLTLNCGYGHGYSVLEVVDAVKRMAGTNFPTVERPRRPGDPAAIVADTQAIVRQLAWAPAHDDIEAIARDALAWERKLLAQT